jgi:hypothetical protein
VLDPLDAELEELAEPDEDDPDEDDPEEEESDDDPPEEDPEGESDDSALPALTVLVVDVLRESVR